MKVDSGLIYDIGMHVGQDTEFYLKKGFRVVAVEANPVLADEQRNRFENAISAGQLFLINKGIATQRGTFPFYVNDTLSEWSSFNEEIGGLFLLKTGSGLFWSCSGTWVTGASNSLIKGMFRFRRFRNRQRKACLLNMFFLMGPAASLGMKRREAGCHLMRLEPKLMVIGITRNGMPTFMGGLICMQCDRNNSDKLADMSLLFF